MASFVTEDALFCRSDPSEFWNKQQIIEMWTQLFAQGSPELNFFGNRVVRVTADGNSATVVDQYFMPFYSTKIPFRNSYHLVKIDGNWKIEFLNCSCIPKNEDLPKLDAALK